jgi:hypothetical protein
MSETELRAFDALATHGRLSDLVALTRAVATSAAEGRTSAWMDAAKVRALAEEAKLTQDDAKTPFGNALAVLERGPEDDAERALARAMWAHAIAEAPGKGREEEDRVATDVLWLATHTPFDATSLLDRALGEAAGELWDAIADRVRKVDQSKLPTLGRAEAVLGCIALSESVSSVARKHATALATELKDAMLARVLAGKSVREETLRGELGPTPRGPVATTALALTGLLFLIHGARLLARFALAYKRPTEMTLSAAGARVHTRTEVLGRTVGERTTVFAREGLARATREVRYPRLGLYAGLLALAIGSYLGVATLIDGMRAVSPSLLLTGVLIVAAGVLLEMLFASLEPGVTGKCNVVLVPVKGRGICVGRLEAKEADSALMILAKKG